MSSVVLLSGAGIYSSPDPMYASAYFDYQAAPSTKISQPSEVPGMRLIICATLMGVPLLTDRASARRRHGVCSPDAHSHVSPGGFEYVVFNSAQIIPVFVVHLDYGAEHARQQFDQIAKDSRAYFRRRKIQEKAASAPSMPDPRDKRRKKEALKAAATRWFPYGYGPAQGTHFLIEDVAEVSDDEENYGEFQGQRLEQKDPKRKKVKSEGESWFDQYQLVRKTNTKVVLD